MGASVSPVQVGKVNGRVFLVNASVGLYPQLLENREAWKQKLGRSRAVAFASGLATLLRSQIQLQLEIESEGQVIALRTPTLFVTLPRHDARAVSRALADRDVLAPAGTFYALEPFRALGLDVDEGLRMGVAPYTDDGDVDRLLEGLEAALR